MKILYIISNTRIGGAERHLLRIAQFLKKNFHGLNIDCLVTHEKGIQYQNYENIFDNVFFQIDIDPSSYDIVHSINNFLYMKEYQQKYPSSNYISCVWMEMDQSFNAERMRYLVEKNQYCAYVTENKDNLDILPSPFRRPNIKRQIYNGMDLNFWKADGEKIANQIIWVGSMIDRKNAADLSLLIKENPDFNFVIVANEYRFDSDYKSFKSLLDMKDIQPNLILRWNLSHEELLILYQSSTFYLSMAKSEGQSGALIESMACECIPIVSNLPATQEILNHKDCVIGKIVNLSTDQRIRIENFSKAIRESVSNNDYRSIVRKRTEELFDINNTSKEYPKLYEEIMNSRE